MLPTGTSCSIFHLRYIAKILNADFLGRHSEVGVSHNQWIWRPITKGQLGEYSPQGKITRVLGNFLFFLMAYQPLWVFKAEAILEENQQGYYLAHSWGDRGVHTFSPDYKFKRQRYNVIGVRTRLLRGHCRTLYPLHHPFRIILNYINTLALRILILQLSMNY